MDKGNYQKYVKTDCWSLRRQMYLKKHPSCEGCGQSVQPLSGKSLILQVHHLTYERLGRESDDDLLAVCEGCHRLMHGLPGATPKTWVTQLFAYRPEGPKKELMRKWLQ